MLFQSLIFLPQPPKPAPSEPPAPTSHGRLCCRAGLTAPPYSHPWPVYPSTHPHLLLFSGDDSRTSQPSYFPPRGQPLRCHPPVFSIWSTTERNKEMTVHGEDDSRDPPASWQYASKCLYITSPKIWFLLMVGHLGLTPLST